jgi:hypothetical protein
VVRIRVINAKDGQPLKNQPITVSLLYEKGEKPAASSDAPLALDTGANGEALLHLAEPVPAHLWAQVRLTSPYWRCACVALLATEDVLQKGATPDTTQSRESTAASPKAQPGEILFIARPLTFMERILYPFVKQ